ncbi:MAG: hypothetical protein P9M14_05010 [Candidatus Alcyoniella australis]|nr:hypothetical protein [Candidatus Alcyoniella australis]
MPSRQTLERNDYIALALLTVVVTLFVGGVFLPWDAQLNPEAFRSHDWLQIASYDHLFRQAILDQGAFPLRTYFLGGGYPLIGNPQDGSLSPLVLSSLVLGERLGMKLNLLLLHLLGAWGTYLFCRLRRGAHPAGAAAAGALLVLSGWTTGRMAFGFYVKFLFLLTPWAFLFIELIPRRRAAIIGLGLTLALILTQLGLGFEVIVLFLGLAALLLDLSQSIVDRRVRPWRTLGLGLGLGLAALLMAGRLAPMIEILRQNSRTVESYDLYAELTRGGTPQFYMGLREMGLALCGYRDLMNWPLSVGPLGLGLAAAGVLFSGIKRSANELLLLLIAAWICLGPFAPIDLFAALWRVPFFSSMHMPFQLFNFFLLWPVVVLASGGVPSLRSAGWSRQLTVPAAALAVVAVLWIGYLHRPIYDEFFTNPLPDQAREPEFYQVSGDTQMGRGSPRSPRSHQYFNLLRNVGTIDWDGDVLLPEHAQPRYVIDLNDKIAANALYRGEAFVDPPAAGVVDALELRSNSIRISGMLAGPALVTINQNRDRWWRVDQPAGVTLTDADLLTLKIERAGAFDVRLIYRPWPTLIGLIISGLTWLALAAWLVFWRRTRRQLGAATKLASGPNS